MDAEELDAEELDDEEDFDDEELDAEDSDDEEDGDQDQEVADQVRINALQELEAASGLAQQETSMIKQCWEDPTHAPRELKSCGRGACDLLLAHRTLLSAAQVQVFMRNGTLDEDEEVVISDLYGDLSVKLGVKLGKKIGEKRGKKLGKKIGEKRGKKLGVKIGEKRGKKLGVKIGVKRGKKLGEEWAPLRDHWAVEIMDTICMPSRNSSRYSEQTSSSNPKARRTGDRGSRGAQPNGRGDATTSATPATSAPKRPGGPKGTTKSAWFWAPVQMDRWIITAKDLSSLKSTGIKVPAIEGRPRHLGIIEDGKRRAVPVGGENQVAPVMYVVIQALVILGLMPSAVLAHFQRLAFAKFKRNKKQVLHDFTYIAEEIFTLANGMRLRPDMLVYARTFSSRAKLDGGSVEPVFQSAVLDEAPEKKAEESFKQWESRAQRLYKRRRAVLCWELKTNETLGATSPDDFTLGSVARPSAARASQRTASQQSRGPGSTSATRVPTVRNVIAQTCSYMCATRTRYACISDGVLAFFLRREKTPRTVSISEAFYLNQATAGHDNPGKLNFAAVALYVTHLAALDFVKAYASRGDGEDGVDWGWGTTPETEDDVNAYKARDPVLERDDDEEEEAKSDGAGDSAVGGTDEGEHVPAADATSLRFGLTGSNVGASSSSSHRAASDRTETTFTLNFDGHPGAKFEVLGGYGLGYMDMEVFGRKCFVKTLADGEDEADPYCVAYREELDHEIKVYRALKPLQGNVIPELVCSASARYFDLRVMAVTSEGASLANALGRDRAAALPGGDAELAARAKTALAALHAHDWLHGDVALRNVVINDAGAVKLVDLGRATRRGCSVAARADEMRKLDEALHTLFVQSESAA